jgi:hypothetical protein
MSQKLGLEKLRKKFVASLDSVDNDSWARVELYRWQTGSLPLASDLPSAANSKPIDIAEGLRAMAKSFTEKNQSKWPTPMSVASVLTYVAKLIPDDASKKYETPNDASPKQ